MVVTWLENFGNGDGIQSYVKYGTQSGGYPKQAAAVSTLSDSLKNDYHHPESPSPIDTWVHSVELFELMANTTYYYCVGTENNWSEENSFTTGPSFKSKENFQFIVGSDSHSGNPVSYRNQLAYHIMNDLTAPRPGLLLSGGDEITGNNGNVPLPDIEWARQWNAFFSLDDSSGIFKGAWTNMLANIPYMTSDSNHIDSDDSFFDLFNYPYPFGSKRLPDKSATESECSYVAKFHPSKRGNSGWYSFNYGNAHFIVLQINTVKWSANPRFCTWNAPIERDQYDWLEDDLETADEDPNIQWKFAIWHAPPYSFVPNVKTSGTMNKTDFSTKASEIRVISRNMYLQSTIGPLLNEYDVDMVFSGHQHRYERSKMIYNDASTHTLNIKGDGQIIEQNDYSSYDRSKNAFRKGVVYLVTGGMGNVSATKTPNTNPYTATRADGSKIHLKANHYTVVEVDNIHRRLTVRAKGYEVLPNTPINFSEPPTTLDEFTIIK